MRKHITIKSNNDGTWSLKMDLYAMQALVSMVRLEMGTGWEDDDKKINDGGKRLVNAIEKDW